MMNNNNTIIRNIDVAKRIAIFSHFVPDADALCGSIALKKLIKNNYDGKIVDLFFDGEIGGLYEHILRDEVVNPNPLREYDLAFVLDCPNMARTGKYKELCAKIPEIFNIDHHATNERFGTYNCVAPKCSSTCEIVYGIAKANGLELDNEIAKLLYQGIITDTNCFTSYNVWAKTHRVVSELMQYKFDYKKIQSYYQQASKAKTALRKEALENLEYYVDDKLVITQIAHQCLLDNGAKYEDTFGIVDEIKKTAGSIISAILIERHLDDVYVSMRGDGRVNIGEVAKSNGGGGSLNLAAYQSKGSLSEIKTQLVEQLTPMLDGLSAQNEEDLLY